MEIIEYNKRSLVDLVRVLRIILRQIMLLDDYMTTSDSYISRVVSNKKLVRYEKGSKYYTFHFTDHYEIMDSRTARKLINSRDMMGFVTLNEKDVVNMNYFQMVNQNGALIEHNKSFIPVSRKGRHSLENYLYFW